MQRELLRCPWPPWHRPSCRAASEAWCPPQAQQGALQLPAEPDGARAAEPCTGHHLGSRAGPHAELQGQWRGQRARQQRGLPGRLRQRGRQRALRHPAGKVSHRHVATAVPARRSKEDPCEYQWLRNCFSRSADPWSTESHPSSLRIHIVRLIFCSVLAGRKFSCSYGCMTPGGLLHPPCELGCCSTDHWRTLQVHGGRR